MADSGYQGITKYHENSQIPIKKAKKHKLSTDEKQYNTMISKNRIYVEHVNIERKEENLAYVFH